MQLKDLRIFIVRFFGIVGGSLLLAISYSWFLVPYKIAPGGVGGLSQILFHIFHIPIGLSMILLNIPLFFLSMFFLGKRFGIRTLIGFLAVGFLTDLVSLSNLNKFGLIENLTQYTHIYQNQEILAMLAPKDIYLSAIAGSVLLGLGIGIIFRFRGSTGGTDIPVAIIKQKVGVSIGTGYWMVETLIILTVGIVFKDLKLVIWGYINLFIASKITDLASEGLPYVKGIYVISDKVEEIKEQIYDKINRGVTYFKAQGGYRGEDRKVLFCALNRRQVSELRYIIKEIDPKAFVYLTDVSDVMGYGFKSRNIDLTEDDSTLI